MNAEVRAFPNGCSTSSKCVRNPAYKALSALKIASKHAKGAVQSIKSGGATSAASMHTSRCIAIASPSVAPGPAGGCARASSFARRYWLESNSGRSIERTHSVTSSVDRPAERAAANSSRSVWNLASRSSSALSRHRFRASSAAWASRIRACRGAPGSCAPAARAACQERLGLQAARLQPRPEPRRIPYGCLAKPRALRHSAPRSSRAACPARWRCGR